MPTYCRHRRIRWLPLTTFAAALLVLALGLGVRVGAWVGATDTLARIDTCSSPATPARG